MMNIYKAMINFSFLRFCIGTLTQPTSSFLRSSVGTLNKAICKATTPLFSFVSPLVKGGQRGLICNNRALFPILALILAFSACNSVGSKIAKRDNPEKRYYIVPEAQNELPSMVVERKEPTAVENTSSDNPSPVAQSSPAQNESARVQQGYRIQLATTDNKAQADSLYDYYSKKLSSEIYRIYEPPYFKLRLGDFTSETDAQKSLEKVRRQIAPDAWIVRDKVYLGKE
jgi:hypothetical protein